MTRSRLVLLGLAWLALLAFAGHEFRAAAQNRAAHDAAKAELRRLRHEADDLRRASSATTAEIALAEKQLEAAAPAVVSDRGAAQQNEIASWVDRVKRLRQLFADQPEIAIPEMRLLTEDDWLRVAKNARFDTEKSTRLALAEMRATAIRQFQSRLTSALAAYNKAFPNQKPASVQALAAYFAAPIDPEILDRYELQDPSGPSGFGPSKWFVQNRAPIDFTYDSRFRISTNSAFQNIGAYAWIPDYHDRSRQAEQDYAKVNSGRRPAHIADAIPFFKPPLAPDVAAKLIESEEKR